MLQVRFGEPDIATAPQAAPANGLLVRRFDAGPGGIVLLEVRRALLVTGGLQGFVLLACLQPDEARFTLGPGATGAQRARRTVPAGEPGSVHYRDSAIR